MLQADLIMNQSDKNTTAPISLSAPYSKYLFSGFRVLQIKGINVLPLPLFSTEKIPYFTQIKTTQQNNTWQRFNFEYLIINLYSGMIKVIIVNNKAGLMK